MWFRRFKGMIRPNMAQTIDESYDVMQRKNIWMVEYLRARRINPTSKAFFRRKYFDEPTPTQENE